jgi:microcystin-dependent protein
MFSLKHIFHSPKADGTDNTLVKPSNWNDEHIMTASASGVVVGRVSAGPGPMEEVPMSGLLPAGMIMAYASGAPPAGWLICDGSSQLRSAYPNLFGVIGSYYGSVDGAHFTLPDLRGRVVAGVDAGVGRLGNYINPIMGGVGGQETEQVYCDVNVSGTVTVGGSVSGTLNGNITAGTTTADGATGNYARGGDPVSVSGTLSGSMNGGNSMSGGGNTRVASNIQPMIIMNYLIKT